MPLPSIVPMQPTLVAKPFHHEGWVYEEKVDGYRMVAYKDGDRVQLVSRQGKDHTRRPDLADAIKGASSRLSPSVWGSASTASLSISIATGTRWARRFRSRSRNGRRRGNSPYGDRLVLSAFGAGFTSGSVYLRWAIA